MTPALQVYKSCKAIAVMPGAQVQTKLATEESKLLLPILHNTRIEQKKALLSSFLRPQWYQAIWK